MAKRKGKAKKKLKVKKTKPNLFSRDDVSSSSDNRLLGIVCIILFLLLSVVAWNTGLNGDDDVQANYASALPSFYSSLGSDTSSFDAGPEIKHYGGVFEILTETTNKIFSLTKLDANYYKVRHLWNLLFGMLGIFFCAKLMHEIAGKRASLLAIGLLVLSPRFLGHAMMNPKDIPFATAYVMALYFIYKVLKQMPRPSWGTLIGLGVAIGLGVGVRINGGILCIAYLGLFLGLLFLIRHGLAKLVQLDLLKNYLRAFGVPALIGLLLGLLFWPYGLTDPLRHIPESLNAFSNFSTAIKVLFQSDLVWSSDIPVKYIVCWMFLTIPLFIILGILAFLFFVKPIWNTYSRPGIVLAAFSFLFPLMYVIAQGSALYDGWRHFTFVYPSLVILVTMGWHFLLERFRPPNKLSYAVMAILGLTALEPLVYQLRNSTIMYTYFNPIAGGIGGAFGHYELDYWGTSVKQAVEWMDKEDIISEDQTDTITIASNFHHAVGIYTRKKYKGKVRVRYQRYRERGSREWDYGIWVNRFIDGSYLRTNPWPTSKTIHEIKANKTPVAIVEKQDDENLIYQGLQAVEAGNWQGAIPYLSQEIEKYPDNEVALTNLGMAYLNTQQLPKAKEVLERALVISPENVMALNYLGFYHFNTQNYPEAQVIYGRAVAVNDRNASAHYYLGVIAAQQNNPSKALRHVQDCLEANGRFKSCYTLGAQLHEQLGDQRSAQAFRNAAAQL